MTAIGLVGASKVPRPAIVVAYKVFYSVPGDLQSAGQVSDTTLQEGQGMHGGFGREQTFNNMAAMGPDFKAGFADNAPMGNVDIAPTLAHIPGAGDAVGRQSEGAGADGGAGRWHGRQAGAEKTAISAPTSDGLSTLLEYQELQGVRYYDRACLVQKDGPQRRQ